MNELLHFLRHAPSTIALKVRLSQRELYDVVMDRADAAGLATERAALASGLTGHVLEVGCGTGHMFSHYPASAEVSALEIDPSFAAIARDRASIDAGGTPNAGPRVEARIRVLEGDGEAMPVADGSVDVVVFSLVLCSVRDPALVLAETKRVLRPGGEVRLIEHVRSERPLTGFAMDLANPVWLALNGQGCRMNRRTEHTLVENGFSLDDVHPFQIYSAGLPAFPMRRIVARTSKEPGRLLR